MSRSRNSTLDVIRALAALEVMFSHVREFVFEDTQRLLHPGLAVKLF